MHTSDAESFFVNLKLGVAVQTPAYLITCGIPPLTKMSCCALDGGDENLVTGKETNPVLVSAFARVEDER